MEMPRQTKTGQEEKAVARGWEGALDSTWADTEEISLLPSCAYTHPLPPSVPCPSAAGPTEAQRLCLRPTLRVKRRTRSAAMAALRSMLLCLLNKRVRQSQPISSFSWFDKQTNKTLTIPYPLRLCCDVN